MNWLKNKQDKSIQSIAAAWWGKYMEMQGSVIRKTTWEHHRHLNNAKQACHIRKG